MAQGRIWQKDVCGVVCLTHGFTAGGGDGGQRSTAAEGLRELGGPPRLLPGEGRVGGRGDDCEIKTQWFERMYLMYMYMYTCTCIP